MDGAAQPVLLDGGLGDYLALQCPEVSGDPLWAASLLQLNPGVIEKAHEDFLLAGAQVITSSSYQASVDGFGDVGREDAIRLIQLSTELAKRAVQRVGSGKVAASLGCYGATLHDGSEYSGDYKGVSEEVLYNFHRERLEIICDPNATVLPDYLAFETIPNCMEAKVIANILNDIVIDIPCWISFACRNTFQLNSGEDFIDALRIASESAFFGIGVNCTAPEHISRLIDVLKATSSKKIIVYPNRGHVYDGVAHEWEKKSLRSDEDFLRMVREWIEKEVFMIGGCCQIGPDMITRMRLVIDTQEKSLSQ